MVRLRVVRDHALVQHVCVKAVIVGEIDHAIVDAWGGYHIHTRGNCVPGCRYFATTVSREVLAQVCIAFWTSLL